MTVYVRLKLKNDNTIETKAANIEVIGFFVKIEKENGDFDLIPFNQIIVGKVAVETKKEEPKTAVKPKKEPEETEEDGEW